MLQGDALRKKRLELATDEVAPHYTADTPLTCDLCERNETCEFAFDWYNTNGDCLESK